MLESISVVVVIKLFNLANYKAEVGNTDSWTFGQLLLLLSK